MIIKTDYRISSATKGYEILLRNKCLSSTQPSKANNTVLFVHGATYGSTSTFDYPIDGLSWMDEMASQGFDAWCIDLLAYGASDRPKEMQEPPEKNKPLVDTAHAVKEVDNAVEFITRQQGIKTLSLIGYSWGTAICGSYAGQFANKLNRLVLSGALWVEQGNSPRAIQANSQATKPNIGAYRTVDAKSAIERWSIGLSKQEIDAIVPASRIKQWCEDVVRCDPATKDDEPVLLKAPTGVMKDYSHCAITGEQWYDPGLITVPTQIVVGEYDQETTPEQGRAVFSLLTNVTDKRMTVIGAGTHTLLLENNRHALYSVVSGFLKE